MRLFRRATGPTQTIDAVLLEDPQLEAQIDHFHSYSSVGGANIRTCPNCGEVVVGFAPWHRCPRRLPNGPDDNAFWLQHVDVGYKRQPALRSLVAGEPVDPVFGVSKWVTVALVPEPTNRLDRNAIRVFSVAPQGTALESGYIGQDSAAIQEACLNVSAEYERNVGCRGLIQGACSLPSGGASALYLRALLPAPHRFVEAAAASLEASLSATGAFSFRISLERGSRFDEWASGTGQL